LIFFWLGQSNNNLQVCIKVIKIKGIRGGTAY